MKEISVIKYEEIMEQLFGDKYQPEIIVNTSSIDSMFDSIKKLPKSFLKILEQRQIFGLINTDISEEIYFEMMPLLSIYIETMNSKKSNKINPIINELVRLSVCITHRVLQNQAIGDDKFNRLTYANLMIMCDRFILRKLELLGIIKSEKYYLFIDKMFRYHITKKGFRKLEITAAEIARLVNLNPSGVQDLLIRSYINYYYRQDLKHK